MGAWPPGEGQADLGVESELPAKTCSCKLLLPPGEQKRGVIPRFTNYFGSCCYPCRVRKSGSGALDHRNRSLSFASWKMSWLGSVSVCLSVCLLISTLLFIYTVVHKKTCHFIFDHNSHVPWWIFTLVVPVETGINFLPRVCLLNGFSSVMTS